MSNFQRRHYEFIAKVIAEMPLKDDTKAFVTGFFAGAFAKENPKFDLVRFTTACAVPGVTYPYVAKKEKE